MPKHPPFKPGNQVRKGKPLPQLTCTNCGEQKSSEYFPKRGGRYKDLKATDPKRYDTQCKRCKKAKRPGQKREDVPEVRPLARVQAKRRGDKTRQAREAQKRTKAEKLTASQYKQKVREETRIQSMLYLAEHGCEECGERDPRKLEYDHKDPSDKKRVIARLITDGYSWTSNVLSTEVAKCRILCANCHRVHTIKQQGYYAFDSVQATLGRLAARYKFRL